MTTATYNAGIALIVHRTGQTQIVVSAAADVILFGEGVVDTRDAMAVAAGYLAVVEQVRDLRAELAAARAGTIGVEHAAAIQEARKVIAGLLQAGNEFFAEYDLGNGPDGVPIRAAMNVADHWLLCDVKACGERVKVLKGGAQ